MSCSIDDSGLVTVNAETRWQKGVPVNPTFPLGGIARHSSLPSVLDRGFEVLDANTRAVLASSINFHDNFNPALKIDPVATTVLTDFGDPNFDIRRQVFTVDLASMVDPGTSYLLNWTDAARISGINNVSGSPWGDPQSSETPFSLECRIIFDETPRTTPAVPLGQVITIVGKGLAYQLDLEASGNTPLVYTLIVGSTAPPWGPTVNIPGITVDASLGRQ